MFLGVVVVLDAVVIVVVVDMILVAIVVVVVVVVVFPAVVIVIVIVAVVLAVIVNVVIVAVMLTLLFFTTQPGMTDPFDIGVIGLADGVIERASRPIEVRGDAQREHRLAGSGNQCSG